MQNLAFIGCGGIGRCHIEGVLNKKISNNLILIDQSKKSIELTVLSIKEHKNYTDEIKITIYGDIKDCKENIDYAVISTLSNVRHKLLNDLVKTQKKIKHIVLEKVLFDRMDQYDDILKFISKDTKIWVNTARRHFNYYRKAKFFLADNEITNINITGGGFGLGCNGIHFLDLVSFFSDTSHISSIHNALDECIYPSKRAGFIEFHGSILGSSNHINFMINSIANTKSPTTISIISKGKTVYINEGQGKMILIDDIKETSKEINFILPLLSEFSSEIALNLLKVGECILPELQESAQIHKPLINLFHNHAQKYMDLVEGHCPIT